MEVQMDSPNKLQKYKSTKKYKLQTPDFSWKLIWTVEPNDKVQKYKSTKVQTCNYAKNEKCKKKCKKHKKYKSKKIKKKHSGASY